MSIEENVQIVKDFFAAMGSGDKQGLLALVAEDIEWIIPARIGRWPVRTAGTRDWRKCFRALPTRWK
jgi:ketosteroid isomerase-like protein